MSLLPSSMLMVVMPGQFKAVDPNLILVTVLKA